MTRTYSLSKALKLSNLLKRCLLIGLATSAPLATVLGSAPPAIASSLAEVAQATIRPTLRIGSSGIPVSELQALLTLLGYYDNPIDGKYQAVTEAAVRTFQQDVGLTSDGIVGQATWAKLLPTPSTDFNPPTVPGSNSDSADVAADSVQQDEKDEPVELPVLRIGVRGPAVTRVQEALRELGFYSGPVDGVFGPDTEAAVISFQRNMQLATDGIVGPATWQMLLQ